MAGEKGASYANSMLALVFQGTTFAGIAQNAASPDTSFYLALHSADPTASGNQTSNEVSYTGYARQAVSRSTSGFTLSGNTVNLASNVSFPSCTGGSATATYWSVGTGSTGTGELLYAGPLGPSISISSGVQPILTTACSISET